MDFVDYTDTGYDHMQGVELMSVGMQWPASTGDYTCTFDQLADIVNAANNDPLVLDPRIKIGHVSDVNGEMLVVNPCADLSDAAPAFGRIVNLRLEGAVLLGDFVEVPAWLADSMPSAYPSRSSEPWLSYTTPGGKQYAAVLTAVSLLGSYMPAITDLEDLQRLMDAGPDPVVAATREEPMPTITTANTTALPTAAPALSVDAGTIADRFNFEWCLDPESIFESDDSGTVDPYWWWARSVRVDPLEIIADGDGDLWRIPVTTDGADAVTFGAPERVREVYVPINASANDTRVARDAPVIDGQRVLASNLARPNKPVPDPSASRASTPTPEEEENQMSTIDIPALRERLGLSETDLPDDATTEQINAAFAVEPAEQLDETDETETEVDTDVSAEVTDGEPVAASTGVQIDPGTLAQLQADAAAGREARTAQVDEHRDRVLNAAVADGRIPPARRAHYASAWENDPEGTEVLLTASTDDGGLATGLIPVTERGVVPSETTSAQGTGLIPELNSQEG